MPTPVVGALLQSAPTLARPILRPVRVRRRDALPIAAPAAGPRGALLPALALAGALSVTSCAGPSGAGVPAAAPSPLPSTASLTVQGLAAPLRVEVARTAAEQERGLMGRREVPAGTGMLFPFSPPVAQSFWMRDTLVPLDIAWIRAGRVVGTTRMAPCPDLGPKCPVYPSPGPVDAALEVGAGGLSGVRPGATVRLG